MKELRKSLLGLLDIGLNDSLSELDAIRLRIYNLDVYMFSVILIAILLSTIVGSFILPLWLIQFIGTCLLLCFLVIRLNAQSRLFLSTFIFGSMLILITLLSYQLLDRPEEHLLYFACLPLGMFFFFYKTRLDFYLTAGVSAFLCLWVTLIDYNPFESFIIFSPAIKQSVYISAYVFLLYKLAAYYLMHEQLMKKWKGENVRYRNIFEHNPAGIVGNQSLDSANPALCRMLGYTKAELSQKQMEDITVTGDIKESRLLINKLYSGELKSFQMEKSYLRKDNSIMAARVQVRGLYDSKGNFLHTTATVIDLTEERKREQELLAAIEKAERSDRLKSAFLANMSHEIRTPMNGIVGFSNMLLSADIQEAEKKEYTVIINDCCNQLLNVVNNVLDIAKIETDSLELHEEETNLNSLLSDVLNLFRLEAAKKSLFLKTKFPSVALHVFADTVKLRQIITNLLSNAIKFTNEGGITLGYTLLEDKIQISVRDTGVGISEAEKASIFERFQRVGATVNKIRGAGLGLAICKGFATALGGQLSFESKEQRGSTFYLSIPYKAATGSALIEQAPSVASLDSLRGKTILIAEDEVYNFKLLNTILQKYGIRILWAKNGEEAVTFAQEDPNIDLILMDVKMPVMNGLEATKIIRTQCDIPIIAQSAQAFQDEKEIILQAGCVAHIAKPIQRTELFDTILKFIDT